MKLQLKLKQICVGAGLAVAALALTACGGGASGAGSGVAILVHNGCWGYYDGIDFCDRSNNYCGTGLNYGISSSGLYYNGQSTGGITSTGGGITSTGGGTGGTTSTGGGTGGTTSTGGGTTIVSTGNPTMVSTGVAGGTTGGVTSTGVAGGTTSTGGTGGTTSSGYTNTTTGIENSTTDTGMMQAMVNMADVNAQANQMVTEFPISFEAARQLVQLQDKMQILQQNHELTGADQQALASAALSVGKVSHKDVVNALAQYANGNKNALTNVELKYAKGIGLPQSYLPMVRDQILPRLGVTLPNN